MHHIGAQQLITHEKRTFFVRLFLILIFYLDEFEDNDGSGNHF